MDNRKNNSEVVIQKTKKMTKDRVECAYNFMQLSKGMRYFINFKNLEELKEFGRTLTNFIKSEDAEN